MDQPLLTPTFLFRFAAACHRCEAPAGKSSSNGVAIAEAMSERHRLPVFSELEGRTPFADLRAGWNDAGLYFALRITGKKQSLWCRDTRIEDSDGLQVWIDTRDTKSIHRAGRFCHRIAFLPEGSSRAANQPAAALLAINRARESPKPIDGRVFQVASRKRADGYELFAHVPAAALTGFDPVEQPRLGFSYLVFDRELGVQAFTLGPEFPVTEDPSLWGTLELRES